MKFSKRGLLVVWSASILAWIVAEFLWPVLLQGDSLWAQQMDIPLALTVCITTWAMLYTTLVIRDRKREDETARNIMEAVIRGMTAKYLREEEEVIRYVVDLAKKRTSNGNPEG